MRSLPVVLEHILSEISAHVKLLAEFCRMGCLTHQLSLIAGPRCIDVRWTCNILSRSLNLSIPIMHRINHG